MAQNFSTGRQHVRDQIQRFSNPNHGRDAFMNVVQSAAPSLDTFLSAQAANGGSEAMAHEQREAAQAQAAEQGGRMFGQHQLKSQQTAAQLSQSLMSDDTQRKQFQQKMQFRRDQQPGFKDMLGNLAGQAVGSFLGPMGAAAGSEAGSWLAGQFGGGGGGDRASRRSPTNPYGNDF